MIVGFFRSTGLRKEWKTEEECSEWTRISVKQVRRCVDTGMSWRGWTFDEFDDPEPPARRHRRKRLI